MKKRFFTIIALSSMLGLSICTTSCENDDDNNPTEIQDQREAQTDAAAFAAGLLEYIGVEENGLTIKSNEYLDAAQNQLGKYQTTTNENYKQLVEVFVGEATGLNNESVKTLLSSTDLNETLNSLTEEEVASLKTNAHEYIDGYHDGLQLAQAYQTVINSNDDAEKEAALDSLESSIKQHYQISEDLIYKQTYVKATAEATGLQPVVIKQILDSPNPKETALLLFGISSDGGQNAEQAATDAAKAAETLKSIKGKSVAELLTDNDFVTEVGTYKELYRNGTPEYQEAFKSELGKNGIPEEIVDMFGSENFDIMAIFTALGVTL